jgi:hypothetical protein
VSFTKQRGTDSANHAPVALRAISNEDDATPLARALARLGHTVHRERLAQLQAAEDRPAPAHRPKDIFAEAIAMAKRQELEPQFVEEPSVIRYRPSLGTASKSAVAAAAAALVALAWVIPNPTSRHSADRVESSALPDEPTPPSSSFAPARPRPSMLVVRSGSGSVNAPVTSGVNVNGSDGTPSRTSARPGGEGLSASPNGAVAVTAVPTLPSAALSLGSRGADPAGPPRREIQPSEVADFVRRARSRLDDGDLHAARLLLLRAAEAHDPQAALSLAKTFDPTVSTQSGTANPDADLVQARIWYQKAQEWGATEPQDQLGALASRR